MSRRKQTANRRLPHRTTDASPLYFVADCLQPITESSITPSIQIQQELGLPIGTQVSVLRLPDGSEGRMFLSPGENGVAGIIRIVILDKDETDWEGLQPSGSASAPACECCGCPMDDEE